MGQAQRYMPLIPELEGRGSQMDLQEFKTGLVYIKSSRPVKVTQQDHVSKNKPKEKERCSKKRLFWLTEEREADERLSELYPEVDTEGWGVPGMSRHTLRQDFLCVTLSLNSLCRPGWPQTQRSVCLANTGIKATMPGLHCLKAKPNQTSSVRTRESTQWVHNGQLYL